MLKNNLLRKHKKHRKKDMLISLCAVSIGNWDRDFSLLEHYLVPLHLYLVLSSSNILKSTKVRIGNNF